MTSPSPAAGARQPATTELVVCSLEPWDEVWRRNQFLVDELLRRYPALRVLFVEPPADLLFDLAERRRPRRSQLRSLRDDGRLQALRPLKALPRRLGPLADVMLRRAVIAAARRLRFAHPTLWLNDVTYAPLTAQAGWPTVYDITDDWLLAPFPPRELARLRRLDALALRDAQEVVVCSTALEASRGAIRPVTLIPNGVDSEHFRRPQPRPADLPPAPVALYAGTLHDARIDIALLSDLAHRLPAVSIVLVGPDALSPGARSQLAAHPNVTLLGQRPYAELPAYLQHADVVVVPHLVNEFTEGLDPIKAYECLAIDTPVVATPVAGFRDLADDLSVVPRDSFAAAVGRALRAPAEPAQHRRPPSWADRTDAFAAVLARVGERGVRG
jgi:glycosyltransferase involved in cell wall biosynthesis